MNESIQERRTPFGTGPRTRRVLAGVALVAGICVWSAVSCKKTPAPPAARPEPLESTADKALECAQCGRIVPCTNMFRCPECARVVCLEHRDVQIPWCEDCLAAKPDKAESFRAAEAKRWFDLALKADCGEGRPVDKEQAAKWYRKSAELGNPMAQWNLAILCFHGTTGVPRNREEAEKWFAKAAEQEKSDTLFKLGSVYAENGEASEAAKWYRRAAEQGHAGAQNNLGVAYLRGNGVPTDPEVAAAWFRLAAEQGQPVAQVNLGNCHLDGTGVPQDRGEAEKWFRKAAEQGNEDAREALANLSTDKQ